MKRTILKGATVIDGTGAPPAVADIAIEGESIAEVGVGLDGDDAHDATGRWVLPGLIDCHVHGMTASINMMRRRTAPRYLPFYAATANLTATPRDRGTHC